jgi:AcrR family transcriptional regulator
MAGMTQVVPPFTSGEDLTAKARIRIAAMELYAENGEDGTSMRAIAGAAGVTVGLLVHHFGTKERIGEAVEEQLVDYFAHAIARVPVAGTPAEFAAARDDVVTSMLAANPVIVNYLRRTILDPTTPRGARLLQRLTELTRTEVAKARAAGVASTTRTEAAQVIGVMVRQLGQQFLQPMIDAMWEQLTEPDELTTGKPELEVRVHG